MDRLYARGVLRDCGLAMAWDVAGRVQVVCVLSFLSSSFAFVRKLLSLIHSLGGGFRQVARRDSENGDTLHSTTTSP